MTMRTFLRYELAVLSLATAVGLAMPAFAQPQQNQGAATGCYSGSSDQAASANPSCEGGIVAPAPQSAAAPQQPANSSNCYSGAADQAAAANPSCEGGIVAPKMPTNQPSGR